MAKRVIVFSLLIAFVACGEVDDKRRTVSVSILPQRFFVEQIAGDLLKVNVMIPPGANPASSDLTPAQLIDLNSSSIYFAIGYLPFEVTHIFPLLKESKHLIMVNHSADLMLIEGCCQHNHEEGDNHDYRHEPANFDPHIWMSPIYAKRIAEDIAKRLVKQFPDERDRFDINLRKFSAEIDSIDASIREVVAEKQNRAFLIYHPALTYFADEYGMEQIAIENEGKEPTPTYLKELVDKCREKSIRVLFIQSQFDVANAEAVAREIGGKVIQIDPLNPDWRAEMIRLRECIKEEME